MARNLPVSRLVSVSVLLSALAAQAQDLSTLLVLSSDDVIDTVERVRTYTTLPDVAADFGTTGPIYESAKVWFSQSPQPKQFKAGRWAKTATRGKLVGGTLSASNLSAATWSAITNGSLKIGMDAQAAIDVTGINFTGSGNLNAVAQKIEDAVRAADTDFAACDVVFNANYNRFEISSGTTGATSKVLFAQAAATGTDISAMLAMRSTSGGAYVADGIAVETALDAATLFDGDFGQTFYGLVIPEAVDADQLAVAAFIEATNNKHIFGITTQDAGVLSSVSTSDIAYQVSALNLSKTTVHYSSSNAYAVASLMGRALTVNYNAENTVITLMYKQMPGIVAESLRESQMQALKAKHCNVFVAYNNDTAIIEPGVMASGEFIDTITGSDAFAINVMNEVFNLLYTTPTKIPQTDEGNNLLVATIEFVAGKYVKNGFLAPGVWDQTGFGNLRQGDYLEKGYYVYAPAVASQFKADRQARKSVPIQVAAKCAGAVHTTDILINVSR